MNEASPGVPLSRPSCTPRRRAAARRPPCARSSRPCCLRRRRRRRDLAEHVDDLLAPAHEVTGRHLRLAQHLVEALARGPLVGGPGEAQVGLALADALRLVDPEAPPPGRPAGPRCGPSRRARPWPCPPGSLGATASSGCRASYTSAETQAASSAGLSPSHTPVPQAFAGQQVQLAVQPGQPLAVLGDLVAAQIVQLGQQRARSGRRCGRWCSSGPRSAAPAAGCRAAAGGSARPSGRGPRARRSRGRGGARIAARSRAISRVVGGRGPLLAVPLAARCARPWCAARRPGRGATAGERGLKDLGIRIRSSASTGTGKSIDASRLTCRSAVSTSGRGPSWYSKPRWPLARPGRAAPGRAPARARRTCRSGTWMTSPGLSFSSATAACGPPLRRALLGQLGLAVLELAAQPRVLLEVAEVAGHGLAVALQALLVALHLPGDADDRLVGLELREGRLQQLARAVPPELARPG